MKSFAAILLASATQAASLGDYKPKTYTSTTHESNTHYDDFEVTRFRNEPRLTYDYVDTDLLRQRPNTVVDTVPVTYYKNFDRVLTRKVPVTVVEDVFIDHELVHAHSSGSEDDTHRSHAHLTFSSDGEHSHSLGYSDGYTSEEDYYNDYRQPFSLD